MIDQHSSPLFYRLQRTLDSAASRHEIVEALEEAEASGEAIPELLRFRAEERVAAERMLERRRLLFAIGCMIVAFATVVGGFGLTTLNQTRSLNQSESEFQDLVAKERWSEASRFLDGLDDATKSNPIFLQGQRTVQQALAAEKERAREFKRVAARLRAGSAEEFDPTLVSRLNELAKSEEELAIASEFNEGLEEQRLRSEAARTDNQTGLFESLQKKVDRFLTQEYPTLDEDERQARRYELQKELHAFISRHSLSNPELVATAKQTVTLLSQTGMKDQQRAKRQQGLSEITESVGDLDRFVSRLSRFAEDNPQDPMADEIMKTVSQRGEMQSTVGWVQALQHPGFQEVDATPEQIAQWRAKVDELGKTAADHPFARAIAPLREHFLAVSRRQEIIAQLRREIDSPLMKPMFVYPGDDDERYYSDQDPKTKSDRAHVVSYFTDLELTRDTKNFGLTYRDKILPRVGLAGHSRFAADAEKSLAGLTPQNFTPVLYGLINEIRTFQSDPEFDPLFRVHWLRTLLDAAVAGSVPLRIAFGDWQAELAKSKFDEKANWISPERDATLRADQERVARRLLKPPADWESRVQTMLASYKNLQQPRPNAPRWVGWVAMQDGQRVAMLAENLVADPVFVVTHDRKQDSSQLVRIETGEGESPPRIDSSVVALCGAMIYSMAPQD